MTAKTATTTNNLIEVFCTTCRACWDATGWPDPYVTPSTRTAKIIVPCWDAACQSVFGRDGHFGLGHEFVTLVTIPIPRVVVTVKTPLLGTAFAIFDALIILVVVVVVATTSGPHPTVRATGLADLLVAQEIIPAVQSRLPFRQ
jgi:hypothetical protein